MADFTMPQTVAAAVPTPPANAAALYNDPTLGTWASKSSAGASTPVSPNPGNTASVAASAAINTVDTIIASSASLPANYFQAGTTYRITVSGTCTSTVANLSTFTLRIGPNGTTADTTIATPTCTAAASGTTIPFTATFLVTILARPFDRIATAQTNDESRATARCGHGWTWKNVWSKSTTSWRQLFAKTGAMTMLNAMRLFGPQ